MAFTDPQSVTISGNAKSMPRTSQGVNTGEFRTPDSEVTLSIKHNYKAVTKRARHEVRLQQTKVAADPLLAGVNVKASASAYLVLDVPDTGFSIAEAKALGDALTAYLTASSGARLSQLLGWEN